MTTTPPILEGSPMNTPAEVAAPPPPPPLRMPEYELPALELYVDTVNAFMRAQNPVLAMITSQPTSSIPTPDPDRTAGVMSGFVGTPLAVPIGGTVAIADIASTRTDAWIESAWDAAREGVAILMPQLYSNLDAAVESVGNVVRAKGAFTWDHWIDMIEKIELSFDESGAIKDLTLVGHPDTVEAMRATPMNADQEKRYNDIVRRKHSEFLGKQRRRRLD